MDYGAIFCRDQKSAQKNAQENKNQPWLAKWRELID